MSNAELFSKNILQTKGMIDMFLKDFSDADMLFRPAKTANHAIWQMGHLANSVRNMVTTCDPSVAFIRRTPAILAALCRPPHGSCRADF